MGTRINVLMDHDISDFREQSTILPRLAASLPAALAVHDHWNNAQAASVCEQEDHWIADPFMPHEEHWRSYTGPGKLFLKVGPWAAKIRTGGRWRGFLSIPPLHRVHLQAFRMIAKSLGATRVAYFPDCDDIYDLFYDGGRYGDAVPILERYFGPAQPSIEIITPEIVEETDRTVPCVWYREEIVAGKTIWNTPTA